MRSDLISRQAAIEEAETRLKAAYVWYDNSVLKDDYALSVKAEGAISALIECVLMLKGLPSAEPERCEDCGTFNKTRLLIQQPEIIRCKDCIYWNHQTDFTYCDRTVWYGTDADDFCSFAERRTDGKTPD